MPRLPMPSDTEGCSEETRAAVRHILQIRNGMPPPSSYLTYAGQVGALLSDLVDHLRDHTSLTAAETELAICTSARAANADDIWNGHVRLGLQAGVCEEALRAVDTHGPLDGLAADEALIIRFGRELLESPQVSDATFTAVRAVRRAGPAGADGRDERVHDERDDPAGDGLPGSGGRAAFDAAVAPQTLMWSRTRHGGPHRAANASTRHRTRARGLRLPNATTPAERSGMSIYRIYAGADGESHLDEIQLAQHPELGALMQVAQVGIHEFSALRTMDFHPLPERRLIIHLRGEVEIGVSDGRKQIFRPGDARLMEDTSGRGHTHQDLSPVIQAVVVLND